MITINKVGDNMEIILKGEHTFTEMTLMLLNALLFTMNKGLDHCPEDKKEQFKKDAYDHVNKQMTAVLEKFAPDFELRPNLTVEALLKAENELIADEVSKMPE